MKALKYTGYGVGGLLLCFIVVGLALPSKVQLERNVMINATPEQVFAAVGSLRAFNRWSPWAQMDQNTEFTFEGPESGVGSRMTWTSDNPEVGSGSSEVTAFEPNKSVTVALDFADQGMATYRISLEPQENGTKATWDFETDLGINLMARFFSASIDEMVGQSYEEGLAMLKNQVEETVAQAGGQPKGQMGTPPEVASTTSGDTQTMTMQPEVAVTPTTSETQSTPETTAPEDMPAFAGN